MKKLILPLIMVLILLMPNVVLAVPIIVFDDYYYEMWGTDRVIKPFEATKEEIAMLEKIVMAEAEGEPFLGKLAVANVVINRVRSDQFPNTIKEVIFQKNQFTPVKNGRYKKVVPDNASIIAVQKALSGIAVVPDDTLYFSNVEKAESSWVMDNCEYVITISNHTFFR